MGNFALRKYIRKVLNEYGNFASNLASPYGTTEFPNLDKDHPRNPTDIDYWDDQEFSDEYSEGGENEDELEDSADDENPIN